MVLGIREDFTGDIRLDDGLRSVPASGIYLNSGAHPCITVKNLLSFLPFDDPSIGDWKDDVDYGVFEESGDLRDVVKFDDKIYRSIKKGANVEPGTDPAYWMITNAGSLKILNFIAKVRDKVLADLYLERRLVNNQYIYEAGKHSRILDGDFAAWAIEPKGSDYITFRINEISLQKSGTTPVNVYIVNQGELIETFQVTPSNGKVSFEKVDRTLSGKGIFYIAIDSTDVITGNGTIDPLKYDGFTISSAIGRGGSPEDAEYSHGVNGNGIGLNITAYLDASRYIENNLSWFGAFFRATFELMFFQVLLHNPNNRSNREESIQMREEILLAEIKNVKADTVVSRYYREKKKAMALLAKTFDTQLHRDDTIEITVGSI